LLFPNMSIHSTMTSASLYNSYDWENDQRWKEYKNTIEFPLANSDFLLLEKIKQRYFKKFIDPNFDASELNSTSTATSASSVNVKPNPANQFDARPQSSRNHSSRLQSQLNFLQRLASLQLIWYLAHQFLLINVFLVIIPVISSSDYAFRRVMFSAMIAYGISLKKSIERNFHWDSRTLSQIMLNDNSHYIFLCLVMFAFSSYPVLLILLPLSLYSTLHVCSFLRHHLQFYLPQSLSPLFRLKLQPILDIVLEYQQKILLTAAYFEFITMPSVLLSVLLGYSNLLLALSYYWFLTFRYLSSNHSRMVMEQIGARMDTFFLQNRNIPTIVSGIYLRIRNFLRRQVQ